MLVLPVAAARSIKKPAIHFNQTYHVPNLHVVNGHQSWDFSHLKSTADSALLFSAIPNGIETFSAAVVTQRSYPGCMSTKPINSDRSASAVKLGLPRAIRDSNFRNSFIVVELNGYIIAFRPKEAKLQIKTDVRKITRVGELDRFAIDPGFMVSEQ